MSDDVSFVFTGIVLTFVGLTFAFISIMDGFTYNDTYLVLEMSEKELANIKMKLEKLYKLREGFITNIF